MTAEGSVYRRKDGRWVAQYKDARGGFGTPTVRLGVRLRRHYGKPCKIETRGTYQPIS